MRASRRLSTVNSLVSKVSSTLRLASLSTGSSLGDDIQPLIAGGAVDAAEGMQRFVFAENLFDHHIKRPDFRSLRIPDQAAQALEILRGWAQAVDVREPQALQGPFRDQFF